eukprot:3945139-Prorocentrum_lima.AAC.1
MRMTRKRASRTSRKRLQPRRAPQAPQTPWWERGEKRHGPVPPPPVFAGNVDSDPRCLKRYLLRLK